MLIFGCAEKVKLSDLQVTACESAAQNNNCEKLSEIGIVKASECCSALGKCCDVMTGMFSAITGKAVLTDIQISACQIAANNNNCDKLSDIGLVTKEQCCEEQKLCCTQITTQEFKNILLQGITNYLSTTPTLNVNEVKDLIEAYFSSTNTVNLDSTGRNSGKKLSYIYNEVQRVQSMEGTAGSVGGGGAGYGTYVVNKTLIPHAFPVRYTCVCGVSSGESIAPGETKYYRIDMTDWVNWQRKYLECKRNKGFPDTSLEDNLREYELSSNKDSFVTVFPRGFIFLGCSPYTSRYGCNGENATLQIALGYNQPPIYEDFKYYKYYKGCNPYKRFPAINATYPVSAATEAVPSWCSDDQMMFLSFDSGIVGANNLYLMVHNSGPEKKEFVIGFECPVALRPGSFLWPYMATS